ncbi:nucleic acid/nucleotide deaminase domain-containing protein [Streptomyces sp. NBC_00224]|uniref:Nucleic acid/nucleotide deaminase domain-containing protein n=1 Tax=Streptomyces sp. NBC_00060 TaxID=2975636 RepID=A0AAU2HAP2_9ACTN
MIQEQRQGARPVLPHQVSVGPAAVGSRLGGVAVQRAPAEGKHQRTDDFPDPGAHKQARTGESAGGGSSSSDEEMEWAPVHAAPEPPRVKREEQRRYQRHPKKIEYSSENAQREARRAAELRMLDRISRILIAGLRSRDAQATPHLAVALAGGAFVVHGNTDRQVTDQQRAGAHQFLDKARRGDTPDAVPDDDKRRFSKDARKLHAFLTGQYQEPLDEEWQRNFAKALKTQISWGTLTPRGPQSQRDTANSGGSVHGEMNLLGHLTAEHMRPERQASSSTSASPAGTTQVYLGGFKKPCRACRWVIDAVNETVGAEYGFEIVAPATHTNYYAHWMPPGWLKESRYKNVFDRVKKKAEDAGQKFDGNKPSGRGDRRSSTEKAYESESDYEAAR